MQTGPSTNKNDYFIDTESGAEMARLMEQDRLITREMGGLFSEQTNADIANFNRILDIGCGPGGWVLEVAYTYPDKEVVGFDISRTMIEYARAQAHVQHLDNASFEIMDASQLLNFPDESFDLVNARTIGFFPQTAWAQLMQECMRITAPGGMIRLTESEWVFSNSAAVDELCLILARSVKLRGGFSPSGRILGIVPMLGGFLRDMGCTHVQQKSHVIDLSYGNDAHTSMFQNCRVIFKLMQPFVIGLGITTQEEMDRLYDQMQVEMLSESFRAVMFLLTVWGVKPENI